VDHFYSLLDHFTSCFDYLAFQQEDDLHQEGMSLVSQGHNVAGTAGVSDEAEVNNPSTASDDGRYTYVVSYYTSVFMVGTALLLPSNMLATALVSIQGLQVCLW